MTTVVFWVFFVLVQGQGMVGSAHSLKDDCDAARVEASALDGVLGVSDCIEAHLSPPKTAT